MWKQKKGYNFPWIFKQMKVKRKDVMERNKKKNSPKQQSKIAKGNLEDK